jgi:negative regulator of flagellin synthesis FlgM
MRVNGIPSLQPLQPGNQTGTKPVQSVSSVRSAQPQDQLTLSPEALLASRIQQLPEIRNDKVAEIRAQIESGKYESAEKLDVALDRLLDELA